MTAGIYAAEIRKLHRACVRKSEIARRLEHRPYLSSLDFGLTYFP
jgi:hypothetical protein